MSPGNVLSIKLAWLELNAAGSFAIAMLAMVTALYLFLNWKRQR
jgi:hypothetical protein